MFDEMNNDRTDEIGQRFGEIKKQVIPPPELEKAVAAGLPYGKRLRTRVHVIRFTKALAAYAMGIALFLGVLVLLPRLLEGGEPARSNPVEGTPGLTQHPSPIDALNLPEAHFYLTGTVSPEEIAELFGQGYSPQLSRWFPVMQIDSADALNQFCTEAGKILSLDYNAPASFESAINEYDDAYFSENALAIGCFWSSDARYHYALTMYSKVGDRMTFGVDDYVGGAEMMVTGNLMVVELPRTEMEGVETFGAYLNEPNGNLSAADTQAVVEIRYGGTHIFSGAYARKLTEDLAALDYTEPQKTNLEMYSRAQIETANGFYVFVVNRGEVYQGDLSAKYSMGSILKQIVDHYPGVIVEDYIGESGYLSEETYDLIAGYAQPTVDGMKSVVRLDSWEELDAFVTATDEEFRTAENSAAKDAFIASKIDEFGEDYFDGYSLLVSSFYSSSGSFSYYLTDVRINAEGALVMGIRKETVLGHPVTDDVVDWIVAIRIPTEMLANVTQYGSIIQ